MKARRAELLVTYNGVDISSSLSDSLLNLSYNDSAASRIDDLNITVEDKDGRWSGSWEPQEGDKVTAAIRVVNWDGPDELRELPCGTFEVDSVSATGPPDTVNIMALSVPAGVGARREKRSKAWEDVTLKTIANDIAGRNRLSLMFEAIDNPLYDRIDQTEQSDFGFLQYLCEREGIALKVSNGRLVLFDEYIYEQMPTVATIIKGVDSISLYSFNWNATDAAYRTCVLTYYDAVREKNISVTYTPPNAPTVGPVLRLNESVDSQAEALRVARKKLREQNKNFGRANIYLAGDIRLSAGMTINTEGWGRFDGKYIIDQAVHSVNADGYMTDIEIRKVLGW